MILSKFDYYKPDTLEEASNLLREKHNSMILAGGTDLLIKIRGGSHRPDRVIDLKGIKGLNKITYTEEGISLGAAVTWTQINKCEKIKEQFPALHEASKHFGCFEIRNRATIGGNICNASPGAEAGGPAVVYEAKIKVEGNGKERIVPVTEFIKGPGRVALEPGEMMTAMILPYPAPGVKSAYRRTARVKGQDLATCAITIMALNPDQPEIREIRAGLSAVFKTPSRSEELEKILSNKPITKEVLKEAKQWLRDNLYPRASSLRGTPDYKREVMGGMLEILLGELGLL